MTLNIYHSFVRCPKAQGIGVIGPPQGLLNPAENHAFSHEKWWFPMKNGGFPFKNGGFMLFFPLNKSRRAEVSTASRRPPKLLSPSTLNSRCSRESPDGQYGSTWYDWGYCSVVATKTSQHRAPLQYLPCVFDRKVAFK